MYTLIDILFRIHIIRTLEMPFDADKVYVYTMGRFVT